MNLVLTVVGARPQFIKSALVSQQLKREGIKEVLIHTGQHYDENMSDIFFKELKLKKADFYLGVNQLTNVSQTANMMIKLEEITDKIKPDVILIYGDTDSTLAGALVAAKKHIKLAHVEAGLRSFNKIMQEEINRIVADRLSDLLFAPTKLAIQNLKKEGVAEDKLFLVGDVMYDNYLIFEKLTNNKILKDLKLKSKEYILATIHRAENVDTDNIKIIIEALKELSKKIKIVLPIHPRTNKRLKSLNIKLDNSNIHLIEPVSYLDMITLEKNSKLIITDSGGVQKEASFAKVYCLTLRKETEWKETIENKVNILSDINKEDIINKAEILLNKEKYPELSLYGDGKAHIKIVKVLKEFINN